VCFDYIDALIGASVYKNMNPKEKGGLKRCSEHTSLRSASAKESTASEKEWLQLTAERFLKEDAQKAEKD